MQTTSNPFAVRVDPSSPLVSSIADGATIKGILNWTVAISGPVPATVEFYIDGVKRWTEGQAPYQYNGDPDGRLNTATLANGPHVLRVLARYADASTKEITLTVTVAN